MIDASQAVVAALGSLIGVELLDVATGSGELALAAARAGATVVAVGASPDALADARHRAEDEGLELDFLAGEVDALEFEEERFDVVASAFGVLVAARPAVAAGELARVTTLGGRIALTTWPQDAIPPELAGRVAPEWTSEEGLRALFAPRGVRLDIRRAEQGYLLVVGEKTG